VAAGLGYLAEVLFGRLGSPGAVLERLIGLPGLTSRSAVMRPGSRLLRVQDRTGISVWAGPLGP
jgi:hypothetical protein